jgi:hypothetical protein
MNLFQRHKGRWLQATNSSFWFEIMNNTVLLFCPHDLAAEHFMDAVRCIRAMVHDVRQWTLPSTGFGGVWEDHAFHGQWRDMTGMFVEMRIACVVHSYTWVAQSPEEQRAHLVVWDPADSDVSPLVEGDT